MGPQGTKIWDGRAGGAQFFPPGAHFFPLGALGPRGPWAPFVCIFFVCFFWRLQESPGENFEKFGFLVRKCQLFLKFLFFDFWAQN